MNKFVASLLFAGTHTLASNGVACTAQEAFKAANETAKELKAAPLAQNRVFVNTGIPDGSVFLYSVAQVFDLTGGTKNQAQAAAGFIRVNAETCVVSNWFMSVADETK